MLDHSCSSLRLLLVMCFCLFNGITVFHSLHARSFHSVSLFDLASKTRCQQARDSRSASSAPTPATVNIVMPWREAHGSGFKLGDCTELPDKVLSALAHLIKARLRGFKVICLFGSNKMPPCWLKAIVTSSPHWTSHLTTKPGISFFECKPDSMEKRPFSTSKI